MRTHHRCSTDTQMLQYSEWHHGDIFDVRVMLFTSLSKLMRLISCRSLQVGCWIEWSLADLASFPFMLLQIKWIRCSTKSSKLGLGLQLMKWYICCGKEVRLVCASDWFSVCVWPCLPLFEN